MLNTINTIENRTNEEQIQAIKAYLVTLRNDIDEALNSIGMGNLSPDLYERIQSMASANEVIKRSEYREKTVTIGSETLTILVKA